MKDIAIIGGSIAGCLAALVFDRLGYRVTVFERSGAVLYDRGAAVSIPSSLFMEMKERDLIDPDTPHITHKCMHYSFASKTEGDQTLLTVPTDIIALRWGELYQQLYKRVNSQCYHRGVAVCQLEERAENVLITLDSGTRLSVDLVIAADGAHSTCRELVCGPTEPAYAGYVLWRGMTAEQELCQPSSYQGINWSVFNGGLAGAYFIASKMGHTSPGNRTLNWGIYNTVSATVLAERVPSLSTRQPMAHQLERAEKALLDKLAISQLTKPLLDAVLATPKAFVQPVVDIYPPRVARGRTALVGDAAGVLRPHSASGISKAAQSVFALAQHLKQSRDTAVALAQWEQLELDELDQQRILATRLGQGLVSNAPDWNTITPLDMPPWWQNMLSGTNWYADKGRG